MKVNKTRRQTASKRPGSKKLNSFAAEKVQEGMDREEDILRCTTCTIAKCDGNCPPIRYVADMPETFAEDVLQGMSNKKLREKYQASMRKIESWRAAFRASRKERIAENG